jgi:outer membrane protein insertion porin family
VKNSFGLGVRLDTPLGLLRLDYGFGKDETDKRVGQFYFGIGHTF